MAPQVPEPEGDDAAELVERFRPGFLEYVATLAPTDPDDDAMAARFLAQLPGPDADELLGRVGPAGVAASVRAALASPEGYLRDAALLLSPWPHAPEEVRCPVHVWVGEEDDRSTTPAVAAWTARFAPTPAVVVRPATTHLSTLLAHWPSVLGDLRTHLGD